MILADKIMDERKKNGWSQEELADKLGVSRQSVSKWESAQSVPDLQRILEMSKLFGVSTDYLLKDDEARQTVVEEEAETGIRRLSMEEANAFLEHNRNFSSKISLGCLICIMCPIPLLGIMALQKLGKIPLAEDPAGALGMVLLLAVVAISLIFIIPAGISTGKWEWLEKEIFDSEYGVDGMVRAKSDKFQKKFVSSITTGIVICMIGVIALISGAIIDENNEPLLMGLCCLMLACVAVGAYLIIRAGITKDGYEKLLQEGDYSREEKSNTLLRMITPAYWMVATGIYLAWSFLTNRWDITWVVWPVAGVLFGAVSAVLHGIHRSKLK